VDEPDRLEANHDAAVEQEAVQEDRLGQGLTGGVEDGERRDKRRIAMSSPVLPAAGSGDGALDDAAGVDVRQMRRGGGSSGGSCGCDRVGRLVPPPATGKQAETQKREGESWQTHLRVRYQTPDNEDSRAGAVNLRRTHL